MPGSVIGIKLATGYVGTVSTSADNIIQARIAKDAIKFGDPVVLLATGEYQNVKEYVADGETFTAAKFAGVAVREVVQANQFDPQSNPDYVDGAIADILTRGQCIVKYNAGTPTAGGTVYVRVAVGSDTTLPVGGFEATSDSTNTVALTNVEWTGVADSNAAEITIKTRNRA